MAWLFLHPHPTLQLRGCVRFHLESPRGCEPTVSPKLFLPSVSVSVLCHDGWERPQPVLAGTYLPGQTPALQLVRVFALQALRDLSEGIQDGKEMGGGREELSFTSLFLWPGLSLTCPINVQTGFLAQVQQGGHSCPCSSDP